VPVRRASDNVVAFAEGQGNGTVRLRLVNLGINPLKKGDVFVTSGAGGLYRPGIAVAVAAEITRDGAIARLLSNPAATDYVLIEPIWAQQARAIVAGAPIAQAENNPDEVAPPP
jgi:rod shape-determining protein MreC